MSEVDIAGLGQCCMDYLCYVDTHPSADQKIEFTDSLVQGGGPTATALVAASRLGLRCAFLGKVGDDAWGGDIVAGLDQEGIITEGVVIAPGLTSQFALIVVDGHGHRTILWTRGTAHPLRGSEICWPLIEGARILHLDGLHAEASLLAAQYARQRGIPVMLDSGTLRPAIAPLLPLIDYLVVTEGFAREYSGTDDVSASLTALAAAGARLVCITQGDRGCAALHAGKQWQVAAYPVEAVDTTGCGDAFHGGLLYALLQEWDMRRCLDFASAVAALKCGQRGGRSGLPTRHQVDAFMRTARR